MLHAKSLGRAFALAILLAVPLVFTAPVTGALAQEEEPVRVIPIEASGPEMSGPEIAGPEIAGPADDGPAMSDPFPAGAGYSHAGPEIEPISQSENDVAAEPFAPLPVDPLMEAASQAAAPDAAPLVDEIAADAAANGSEADRSGKKVELAAVDPAADAKPDIYDQWVHDKFSSRPEVKEHPYALRHPDHFVVVCEAGCSEEQAHVVYLERRDARGPVNETPISKGTVAGTASIDCVGGCYDYRERYAAVRPYGEDATVSSSPSEDGWMSTAKPDPAAASSGKPTVSDGRWYERIN